MAEKKICKWPNEYEHKSCIHAYVYIYIYVCIYIFIQRRICFRWQSVLVEVGYLDFVNSHLTGVIIVPY
jgi:hypothetical protein